ncbi:MAG: tRNA uridine-5-carboxymethylaminomethyl(34) synthesis GTPase MnmE [Puniceicoccaceae bacterium]
MTDTIVAQSTPHGISALALIRASGPDCLAIAEKLLRQSDLSTAIPRQATFSRLRDASGNLIDEVVWIYYADQASYTGEPMLEIMPHGNPIICKKIIATFIDLGCRLAEPGEFTQRAYLNGKLNFSQVEGVLDVIHAQSDRALFYARKHLTGESGRLIKGIVQELTSIRAEIEAYIDFPEDELPPEDQAGPLMRIRHLLETLSHFESTVRSREAIQNGIDTLIIGAPNVGKSSLMNALVGHRRALVSDQAGTTRDYIVERTFVGDYLINLFDTAGLNTHSLDQLESEGIERTLELIEQASFYLIVLDATQPEPQLPIEVTQALNPNNTLVLANKMDLPSAHKHNDFLPNFPHIGISTFDHQSILNLLDEWKKRIEQDLDTHEEEDVMFNHRQGSFIREAHKELSEAQRILRESQATELAAFHLIAASDSLVRINERVDHEAVLDDLFKRFCIGK